MLKRDYCGAGKEYCNYKKSKFVILPIPFERSLSYGKGAQKGPRAIIDAAKQTELYDIDTESEVYKNGIYVTNPIFVKKTKNKVQDALNMIEKASKVTSRLLENNKFIITLGGEHTISLGPIFSFIKKYPDLTILHFDAHSDRRDNYEKNKYSHACIIKRIIDEYPKTNIISVGLRSADATEKKLLSFYNNKIFYAKDIYKNNLWHTKAIQKMSKNVYITLDVDVFDPSIMPSTGTPEPGGMLYYDLLDFIKIVIKERKLVGMDIVELSPIKGLNHPDFLISKLIYQIISYLYDKK